MPSTNTSEAYVALIELLRFLRLFILASLITFRLARLLALEEGPFGLFDILRDLFGAYDYGPSGKPESNLGRLAVCPHCWGLWIAILPAVLMADGPGDFLVIWLAVAGAQSFLESVVNR